MSRRPVIFVIILAVFVLTIGLWASHDASATEFQPQPPSTQLCTGGTVTQPNGVGCVANLATGLNQDVVTSFNIPAPGANFSSAITFADPDFVVANHTGYADGTAFAEVHADASLGLLNQGCLSATPVNVNFTPFMKGSVVNSPRLAAGSAVGAADTDNGAALIDFAANEKHSRVGAANGTWDAPPAGGSATEVFYRDVDASNTVTAGDVRLGITGVVTNSLNTVVAGGASDIGLALEAFAGTESHRENITVNGTYDPGEGFYRDPNNNLVVDTGETRLVELGNAVVPSGPLTGQGLLLNYRENDGDINNDSVVDNVGRYNNGIPDGLEWYPNYLNELLDPDGAGAAAPIAPRVRYTGFAVVSSTTIVLHFLLFDPGVLTALPNGDLAIEGQGVPSLTVLQNPRQTPNNSSISDFCTGLTTNIVFCGRSDTSVPSPTTWEAADSSSVVPNGCTTGGGGSVRQTSPSTVGTREGKALVVSLRDLDGDGIEQGLDSCPAVDNTIGGPGGGDDWDPRATNFSQFTAGWDGDGDGIPNTTRVLPALNWVPDSCDSVDDDTDDDGIAENNDQDGDGWSNRLDNCPQVANAGAATDAPNTNQFDEDITYPTAVPESNIGPRGDGIGAACEADDFVPNGHAHRSLVITRTCVTNGVNGQFDFGEIMYRDTDNSAAVSIGDVRLTAVGAFAAGSTVAAGNADIGTALILFDSTPVPTDRHAENVTANGIFDPGENMYRDTDNSAAVSIGDVRLTAVGAFAAGSTVAALEGDIGTALILFDSTPVPTERHADADDLDGDGVCNHADPNDFSFDSDGDAQADATDNCPSVSNAPAAGQTQLDTMMLRPGAPFPDAAPDDTGADGVGDACDGVGEAPADLDADGYSDKAEIFMNTSRLIRCSMTAAAGDEPHDPWPLDFNDNQTVQIDDINFVSGNSGATLGAGTYTRRADIAGQNGKIDIADIAAVAFVFGSTCTPVI